MDLGIRGKKAFVAAGSRGIGKAVAHALAKEGADLVICARGREELEGTAMEIEGKYGVKVKAVVCDLSYEESVKAAVSEALDTLGRIDILFTNAGGPPVGGFEDVKIEDWDHAYKRNFKSVIELCKLIIPGMKERKWGRIIALTSVSVKYTLDRMIISNSIRLAVTGFIKSLSIELAPYNITVNAVAPGYTLTERIKEIARSNAEKERVKPEDVIRRIAKNIPMGRMADPMEIADVVAFLASERASFITGVTLPVDGGQSRHPL